MIVRPRLANLLLLGSLLLGAVAPSAAAAQSARRSTGHATRVVSPASGDVWQGRPHAYQDVDGQRRAVPVSYTVAASGRVGFTLGPYDPRQPLVIDPLLAYATYLGGRGSDYGGSIAVDGQGSAYVTGYTASADVPTTTGAYSTTSAGGG